MDRVKLRILGLSHSMTQDEVYALILADEQDIRRLPIIIGMSEAQAIAVYIEKKQTQHPLIHDLFKKLTDKLNVTLKEVMIYRLEAGIFYSELLFETPEDKIKIYSRTSDAVILALHYECDIYTTPEIIQKVGLLVSPKVRRRQEIFDKVINIGKNGYCDYTVEELKKLMNDAIRDEDYETASKYRDLLKDRENNDFCREKTAKS